MRRFVIISTLVVLTACAHTPIVSDFQEGPDSPSLGNVIPLTKTIEGKSPVFLVMIHGVGDHCPGYALKKDGWLNNDAASKYGIQPLPGSDEPRVVDISDTEFLPQKRESDPHSKVSYQKSEFVITATGQQFTAIEITWSQLTQWVKTQQLGYDSTTGWTDESDGFENCLYEIPTEMGFPYSKSPPSRATINRVVKERVFNRSLADAVLYVGAYGQAIQRGVAEALCRSLGGSAHTDAGGKPDGQICIWPDARDAIPDNARLIFITHSLGSRALYDTLLGLTGDRVNPNALVFSNVGPDSEVQRSREIACRMISYTSSIYMMANQMAMLGLAYDDASRTSGEGPQPYDVSDSLPIRGCGIHTPGTEVNARLTPPDGIEKIPVVNVFSEIWRRARASEGRSDDVRLSVVSFNDTNDLLTWNVPRWYANQRAGITLPLQVTNVFVSNDTAWLRFFENPAAAHSGYFRNDDVWSVIMCGASNGRVPHCD